MDKTNTLKKRDYSPFVNLDFLELIGEGIAIDLYSRNPRPRTVGIFGLETCIDYIAIQVTSNLRRLGVKPDTVDIHSCIARNGADETYDADAMFKRLYFLHANENGHKYLNRSKRALYFLDDTSRSEKTSAEPYDLK